MDEKLKKLVDEAERMVSLTSGDTWAIDPQGVIVSVEPERNYPVPIGRHKNKNFIVFAKNNTTAICAALREQDKLVQGLEAEIAEMRKEYITG